LKIRGWRDLKDQIGKSGKNISAKLYMAFGVSGAIHHVLGIGTCKTVVAVDTDPIALIFNYADGATSRPRGGGLLLPGQAMVTGTYAGTVKR
jgi:hypothetical protein